MRVRSLTVRYGGSGDGIRELSFEMQPGGILGIVGESGAGKSTVCRALMGLQEGAAGSVVFRGREMIGMDGKELRKLYSREISLMPQGVHALNPMLAVGRHITETLRAHGRISRRAAKRLALSLLGEFRLPDAERVFHACPHQLSGGMNRRVASAVAFSCDPSLVIADEPTRGLDRKTRDAVLATIRKRAKTRGTAVLMVTHDLSAASFCDRIGVLRKGRFVEMGSAKQVLGAPRHPYTGELVRAMPENWTARERENGMPLELLLHCSGDPWGKGKSDSPDSPENPENPENPDDRDDRDDRGGWSSRGGHG